MKTIHKTQRRAKMTKVNNMTDTIPVRSPPQEAEVRQFRKDMMDPAFIEKDDIPANKLADQDTN